MEVTGDFLSLTRARKEKSRPSRAMAKMIRGRGNMEPNRLGVGGWVGCGGKRQIGDGSCRCRVKGTTGNKKGRIERGQ